jgi:Transposase DDE domain
MLPNEVEAILSEFDCLPKRRLNVTAQYLSSLTLGMKRHSFRAMADASGLHESRFCAMLNDPSTENASKQILCRAVRRRLKRLKLMDGRLVVIIDATIKKRRGKKVENVRRYHSGSGLVMGHKFVNFVVLDGNGEVIPLQSIPVYTKDYCKKIGTRYQTEIDIVETWLKELPGKTFFPAELLKSAIFLLDSGYDAKPIQRAIKEIGADFVMALKSSRTVNGRQVSKLFRASRRWLAWESIRLKAGSGGRGSRRIYSIRTASGIRMKGFGLVHVVCSKADHNRKKPRKFLATSCPEMSGRDIVRWYTLRWKIETWHKTMKQNFGFIDCHSARFRATESHINFSLTAYLLHMETGKKQMRVEEFIHQRELRQIRAELTRFDSAVRLKIRLDEALRSYAA